jgi:hypothetical protein
MLRIVTLGYFQALRPRKTASLMVVVDAEPMNELGEVKVEVRSRVSMFLKFSLLHKRLANAEPPL